MLSSMILTKFPSKKLQTLLDKPAIKHCFLYRVKSVLICFGETSQKTTEIQYFCFNLRLRLLLLEICVVCVNGFMCTSRVIHHETGITHNQEIVYLQTKAKVHLIFCQEG